jgi:choline-sulfatase
MERQQFYKMVPYEASANVPMVIADGRGPADVRRISQPTQLIDIFPTIMDLAGVPPARRPVGLDGQTLVGLFGGRAAAHAEAAAAGKEAATEAAAATRPPFVVSQFHGDNLAASWFLVVQTIGGATYKLIVWGTGQEVPSMLYNLTADEGEQTNLLASPTPAVRSLHATLESSLRSVVSYPEVATQVARYNHARMAYWINSTGPGWVDAIHAPGLR